RAELAVGGGSATVANDCGDGHAWRRSGHRIPLDRTRLVLGPRDRPGADSPWTGRPDRLSTGRPARALERARHARGARHGGVRPGSHAVAARLRAWGWRKRSGPRHVLLHGLRRTP